MQPVLVPLLGHAGHDDGWRTEVPSFQRYRHYIGPHLQPLWILSSLPSPANFDITALIMPNYVPYSDVYDNQSYATGPGQPERTGLRYDPTEDAQENARRQQIDSFNRPGARRADLNDRNLDYHQQYSRYGYMRERSADDAYRSRRGQRYQDDYGSESGSGSEYEQDDRQRRRNSQRDDNYNSGRRVQSEKRGPHKRQYDGDVKGLVGRNLDLTPNGALFAALGAGVGAIGARRFGANHFNPKKDEGGVDWKTIGGAVVGGLIANGAEKRWQERKQSKMADKDDED